MKKIAIIGAGVAGLTAAYLLRRKYEITLFEKNDYMGGHTNTIEITSGPDRGTPVDTGFIVYNEKNYPTFVRLLNELGIEGGWSDMSFGYSDGDVEYSSYFPMGLFAQKRNLVNPSFLGMIQDMLRFNKKATADLLSGRLSDVTLGAYIDSLGVGDCFRDRYLIPITAALWSTSPEEMREFPAEMFARFFYNHGLLSTKKRARWKTIPGGSHRYVKKILESLPGQYHVRSSVSSVRRSESGVTVKADSGQEQVFDSVVIATHADAALNMLSDPTGDEKDLLGAWTYTKNDTIFHTDNRFMPKRKAAWASWNYTREITANASSQLTLTYHMNRLQNLTTKNQYFVTLNTSRQIPEDKIIRRMVYTHPRYTFKSLATQPRLAQLNGVKRTYYCGSYFHFGFHEDAVKSAVAAVAPLGVSL